MSRIGKEPVNLPDKVKVSLQPGEVKAEGPLGSLTFSLPAGIGVNQKENKLFVEITDEKTKNANAMYGTVRARVNNLLEGVSKGFTKVLEIKGLGYRAQVAGDKINLELGFSHPVTFNLPKGVTAEYDAKKNLLSIKGVDKALVGDVAASIKRYRPPEPYKGSGIRYLGERILRKAGKSASAGSGK